MSPVAAVRGRRAPGLAGGAGLNPYAASFVNASNQALTIASNSTLVMAASDWAFCGWVKFATTNAYRKVLSKQVSDFVYEYGLQLNPTGAGGSPGLEAFTTGVVADSSVVIVAGTWYWFYVDFTLSSGLLTVSVNNGAAASQTGSAPSAGVGTFGIGWYGGTTTSFAMDGQIAPVGLWKRTLTAGEKATIYNAGHGVRMGSLGGAFRTSLISTWDFNNLSNLGLDGYGTNHLTNVAGVTAVAGVS